MGTVNNGLFRIDFFFSSFNGVEAFQGTNGSKGPARTTLALVLDGRKDGSPVNRLFVIGGTHKSHFGDIFRFFDHTSVKELEFFKGEVHELILSQSEGRSTVVVDKFSVGFEDFKTVIMFGSSIVLVVFGLPSFKADSHWVFVKEVLGIRSTVIGVSGSQK